MNYDSLLWREDAARKRAHMQKIRPPAVAGSLVKQAFDDRQ